VRRVERGLGVGWLAVGLLVFGVGCGSEPPDGGPVQLLTGIPPGWGATGCFTNSVEGLLVTDPKYGTAIIIDTDIRSSHTPVAWRPGFTARRAGPDEVEVLAPDGHVAAVTGRRYRIDGGSKPGWFGLTGPLLWACDRVTALGAG
jgi:hypothetical protein